MKFKFILSIYLGAFLKMKKKKDFKLKKAE